MSEYSYFQTIINFKINNTTLRTEMTNGFTRAVKGTGKATPKKKTVIKKKQVKADDVQVEEW